MAKFFREILFIIALTALGAVFSLFSGLAPLPWAKPELAAGEIQPNDARALQVIWIDARSEADYHTEHIPAAIYLDEDHWETGIIELMDAWLTQPRPIVVYCGSERCDTSKRIAERLREALPDAEVYSLKGGWDSWLR
tara:strand:+ start:1703 stop:2116 length:414 start_codon:yes stop_codon:yes gene_type:complete